MGRMHSSSSRALARCSLPSTFASTARLYASPGKTSQPPKTRSSSEARGTKSRILGARPFFLWPSRIVDNCVSDPNGSPRRRRARSTPAIVVVATAPIPGKRTASFPVAGRMRAGRFAAGLLGRRNVRCTSHAALPSPASSGEKHSPRRRNGFCVTCRDDTVGANVRGRRERAPGPTSARAVHPSPRAVERRRAVLLRRGCLRGARQRPTGAGRGCRWRRTPDGPRTRSAAPDAGRARRRSRRQGRRCRRPLR